MSKIEVIYTPVFLKRFNKLEKELKEEALEKIELFIDTGNHKSLRVHKLKGRLDGRYSFSVSYKVRVVFRKISSAEVAFLDIGSHDVYK